MANELQEKLNAILEDKNTNLPSSNLRVGTTCLGVNGILKHVLPDDMHVFDTTQVTANYPYCYRTTNKYAMMYDYVDSTYNPVLINLETEKFIKLGTDYIPSHPHNFFILDTSDGVILMVGKKLEKYTSDLELVETYYTFSSVKAPLYRAYKGYGSGVGGYTCGAYTPICLNDDGKLIVYNSDSNELELWEIPVAATPVWVLPNFISSIDTTNKLIYTMNLTDKTISTQPVTSNYFNNQKIDNTVAYMAYATNTNPIMICNDGSWITTPAKLQYADESVIIAGSYDSTTTITTVYKIDRTTKEQTEIGTFEGSNSIYPAENLTSMYANDVFYVCQKPMIIVNGETKTLTYNDEAITDTIYWIKAGDGTVLGYAPKYVFTVDTSTGAITKKMTVPDYSQSRISVSNQLEYEYNGVSYTLFYATGRLAFSRENYSHSGTEPFIWNGTNCYRLFSYRGMTINGDSGGNYFEFTWGVQKRDLDEGFYITICAEPSLEGMSYGDFFGPRMNITYTSDVISSYPQVKIEYSQYYGGPWIGGPYWYVAPGSVTDGSDLYTSDDFLTTSGTGDYWNFPDMVRKGKWLMYCTTNL